MQIRVSFVKLIKFVSNSSINSFHATIILWTFGRQYQEYKAFLATLDKQFANRADLKEFATQLQENFGLRGGGDKTTLQGGGGKFDAKLEAFVREWLTKN